MVITRTIKAAIITSSWHFYSQLARLVSNLILTRLLVPEMFGLMSIAMLVISGASMLSDVGTFADCVHLIGSLVNEVEVSTKNGRADRGNI